MTSYLKFFYEAFEQIQISNQPISLSHHKYNRPANTNTDTNHPSISTRIGEVEEFASNVDSSIY